MNILGSGRHGLDNGFITRSSSLTSNDVFDDHPSRDLKEQNDTLNNSKYPISHVRSGLHFF